ncbi:hypothetical protein I5M32_08605 [Pedobacter sp. SD-b]|uniref:Outer membrane protein beta-barrel domain-containing protein n=1 Tax=Pedobacter segetis TaxID=2793069 RepID=A0ABS1BJL7_9SPHI|nr:hypothetical protein [Pedobacter segetis]MBK0383018.1 hypothetical protein [Pedobacter segetis]
MGKFYLLLFFVFIFISARAQDNNGPRITALGNAGVALQDVWSVKSNQAGIAGLKRAFLAAGYENKFGVKGLSNQSAVFSIPVKDYALGASFNSYGVSDYNEIKTGLTLARSFGPKLFLAIGLNYHQLKITDYGSAKAVSVDVGVQYQAFPNLWLASHISNPNQSKYDNNTDQIIPAHIQFGANYIFSDQLLITTEVEKILDAQADFKAGLEYKLVKFVALRGGISVNPFKQYAGFGVNYQRINIDFAVSSHPVLGYSPQVALGYEF